MKKILTIQTGSSPIILDEIWNWLKEKGYIYFEEEADGMERTKKDIQLIIEVIEE